MKIYHVNFTTLGKTVSGGETTLINMVRFFVSKKIKNIILTTDNGKKMVINAGLKESQFVAYKAIETYEFEQKHHPFISYIQRTREAIKFVKSLNVIFLFNSTSKYILLISSAFLPIKIG